jgi:hypothetical protein
MRRTIPIVVAAALTLAPFSARAAQFSKTYVFKAGTTLQVGTEIQPGLRLDSVEFLLPEDDGSPSGLFNGPRVKVAISNLGEASVRVGIALAVTDDDNRLVGAASGGTKMFPLRADRQMVYTLEFEGVNAELSKGTTFRISIEPRH